MFVRVGSVGEFAARLKERDMPKAKSAENAKMANDRAGEKLALASQRAGRTVTAHADKPAAKVTGTPKGVIGTAMGSKPQWVSLVNLLKAGGREEAGGLTAVDFGKRPCRAYCGHCMFKDDRDCYKDSYSPFSYV